MKAVFNVKLITKERILENSAVVFDEKIVDIVNEDRLCEFELDEVIDGEGMYLSPGFIDIHIHGCSGEDVMDGKEETLNVISKNIASTGVTSFLATTMTMEAERIKSVLLNIASNIGKTEGAQLLGCHLEGPFISKKFKGAQDEKYIINPSFDEVAEYKDIIKIITIAPENDGSVEFIKKCIENNIIVSIGHSNATYEEAMAAVRAGVTHITHTFNAMTPLHHRDPGIVGAAMVSDVSCELIADNIHVHPAVQEILLRMKGIEKVILITDAMRACLMKDGNYDLGGQEVIVKENQARLPNGALAGSTLTIDRAIRNFLNNTKVDIKDAISMVTENPARILKLEHIKGSIDIDKDADMVMFDENIQVHYTFVCGKLIVKLNN